MGNKIGAVYLMTAASLWGGSQVISKMVMQEVLPMTFTFLRFVMATVILGIIALLNRKMKIDWKEDGWRVAILGLLGYTLSIGSQLLGLRLSSAHMGTMITSTPPIFMLLFSAFLFREKVTLQKIIALLLAGMGVVFMVGADGWGKGTLAGNLLLVIAAVSWALYSVYGKTLTLKYSSMTVTFWALCFGALFTLPLSCWEIVEQGLTLPKEPGGWLGIGYVGMAATAVGFYLWNRGVELFVSSTAGLFLFIQPLFGSFLAWLFLHEKITPLFFLSSILIVCGIGFSFWNFRKRTCRAWLYENGTKIGED